MTENLLTIPAFQYSRVFRDVLRQEIQRDKATEFRVLGLVHHTHPPASELLDDAVMRDDLADQIERDSTPVGC
jgi:hypothetical protein